MLWFINYKLKNMSKLFKTDEKLIQVIETLEKGSLNLEKGLREQSHNFSSVLQKTTQSLNQRLDRAALFISQVSKDLGQMKEASKSIRDLQLFLQSPKIRGNIGEEILKDLISQIFPKGSFYLQYSFKNGEKVDAAIKTSAGILPIDSKFPMENYRKMITAEIKAERIKAKKDFINDVKKHIKDIARKYILPEEGTLDFAFMYLPSETIFYEVVRNSSLLDYARSQRIYPVSPNTLYVHLQTVLLSFEGQKIEAQSRQIFKILRAAQKDYQKTESLLQILSRHINNAYNQFYNVLQSFSLLGQKLSSTESFSGKLEQGEKKR